MHKYRETQNTSLWENSVRLVTLWSREELNKEPQEYLSAFCYHKATDSSEMNAQVQGNTKHFFVGELCLTCDIVVEKRVEQGISRIS